MSEPLKGKEEREQGSGGAIKPPFFLFSLSSLPALISILIVSSAAVWLYRRALGFAYFNDDPSGHFAWMEGQALWQFFAGSAAYGYYRPVVFAVLRLSELFFGNDVFPHNPAADHALLVMLHAANVGMVWLLARRLSGLDLYGWIAALVFAFVPFSYEAVAYVASLTHPLVVFWTLLSLLLYDHRRPIDDRRPAKADTSTLTTAHWSLAATLLIMTLGLLTHENGLFILPALVGLDWARRPKFVWHERARRLWPYAVPPLLFAALWVFIPKNSEQGLNSVTDIGRNAVPFLQTLVYPLLPIFRLDSADTMALLALSVTAVAVFGWLAWRAGAWRLWAFALSWFILSSLPALLFLGPAYVYGSPRLSYLPSVGVGLMWGIPVLWLYGHRRATDKENRKPIGSLLAAVSGQPSAVHITLTAAYLLAIVLPPLPFIRCQLDFYDETSRYARGMAFAGAKAPVDREVVFVNAPFFFSSTAARPDGCPSPYPWTPVGGILIPPYAQARDFVRFNGGPDRVVSGVTYAGYAPGWRAFGPEIDGPALRDHAGRNAVYVFDLQTGGFTDLSAHWQPASGPVAAPVATFGDALALAGAEIRTGEERLSVTLDWLVLSRVDAQLTAFVHVYDAVGTLVVQSDGPPGHGLAPQNLWTAGDGLVDERVIDLSSLPPGSYRVAVGVYNSADGARLAAASDGLDVIENAVTLGTLER